VEPVQIAVQGVIVKAGKGLFPACRPARCHESVFGQIKERRGFPRFLLRGLGSVEAEWKMIYATHNC
jgi:Transposase DDE domain